MSEVERIEEVQDKRTGEWTRRTTYSDGSILVHVVKPGELKTIEMNGEY